jgi:biopolymer transport protein ExbB/TolQ
MENFQNLDTWVWVVAAVGLLVVLGVLAALGRGKKRGWDHSRAEAMRSKVEQDLPELRKREASVLEKEAQAERARADAERLEAQARERRSEVEDQRSTLEERLREADERDPLVDNEAAEHRQADNPPHRA